MMYANLSRIRSSPDLWRSRTSGFEPIPHLRVRRSQDLASLATQSLPCRAFRAPPGLIVPEWTQVGMSQDPCHDNAKQTDPSFRFCVDFFGALSMSIGETGGHC
jgi:hypothetical protein